MTPHFIGIDVGTQGARSVLLDTDGNLLSSSGKAFELNNQSLEEQSTEGWWNACRQSLKELLSDVKADVRKSVKAIAVTSTSGTVIPLDSNHKPLHPALMYSDKRSATEAAQCRQAALDTGRQGYTGFNSSSGLPKMVWFVRHFPDKASKISSWAHAADYITGRLSGSWAVTDYTNALKSGYDIREEHWPEYLWERLPLQEEWLPDVIPAGTPVGTLSADIAEELGLPPVQVVAGMTDGCASQIAAGAVYPGDWNTTIGTTLVIKGVTRQPIEDPRQRLYNHRHPMGWWLPGGASNTGADWITREFSEDLESLNEQAADLIPTGYLSYPLRRKGERFPFISPEAQGFEPNGLGRPERFTAGLEGVAYIERYAFEVIERLSGEKINAIYTAGGGSKSDIWLKIRSNVLGLPVYKMKYMTGAVGAAILAASQTYFSEITEAVSEMTQIDKQIDPTPGLAEIYEGTYQQFLEKLEYKGYITMED
jgi:sugar (pentulose or hexulose) kinase